MALRAPAIGIDIGATYSRVGVWQKDHAEIIPNSRGNRATPSYIAFTAEGRITGDKAMNEIARHPNNTVFAALTLIGARYSSLVVQDNIKIWPFKVVATEDDKPSVRVFYNDSEIDFSPVQLCAMIMSDLKQTAEDYLGRKVTMAVITVPALFNFSQRQAVKDAGAIAGLQVLQVVNAAAAVIMSHKIGMTNAERSMERNVLAINLGGGALNLSVATIEFDVIEMRATGGNSHLGAEFENRLIGHFIDEFKAKFKKDISGNKRAMCRLRTACENAKRTLSGCSRATVEIDYLHEDIDFYSSISRDKFEEICKDVFSTFHESIRNVLRDAGVSKDNLHDVLVVGGSSKIPKIRQLLKDLFEGKPVKYLPDEDVAKGAAVQAAFLTGAGSFDTLLLDVAPSSLGIEMALGSITRIIARNSTIPHKRGRIFVPQQNHSRMQIKIYEGEHSTARDNHLLCEFSIYISSGLAPPPSSSSSVPRSPSSVPPPTSPPSPSSVPPSSSPVPPEKLAEGQEGVEVTLSVGTDIVEVIAKSGTESHSSRAQLGLRKEDIKYMTLQEENLKLVAQVNQLKELLQAQTMK